MNHKFKIKQRVAALCMAAMMCCSLFPAGVFAEAPRADADGTLIMEQDKEAVTDDSHQTEASDPDPGEESTPQSSEAAATSQSADEDAPVETSTGYTFDGAVLYTDLPDAPTGSYMGSQGLPVATGETKIGISAWPNDQLEESTDSSLKELQKLRQLLVRQLVHDLHGQVFCAAHLGSKLAGVGLAGSHVPNIVDQVLFRKAFQDGKDRTRLPGAVLGRDQIGNDLAGDCRLLGIPKVGHDLHFGCSHPIQGVLLFHIHSPITERLRSSRCTGLRLCCRTNSPRPCW